MTERTSSYTVDVHYVDGGTRPPLAYPFADDPLVITTESHAAAALDLLPCPWCGGTTLKVFPYDDSCREYSVDCWDCEIHGPYARTEALAVERWNGRSTTDK